MTEVISGQVVELRECDEDILLLYTLILFKLIV